MLGGTDQGVHYATPTCSAPATMPSSIVQVVLADMGMTQMMGRGRFLGGADDACSDA